MMQRQLIALIRVTYCTCLVAVGSGCMGGGPPPPPEMCLRIEATARLNLFEGEPHVVALYFYPLLNTTAFHEADARDLLRRIELAGQTGQPFEATFLPGEERDLREKLPRDTAMVGIVADFFEGPSKVLIEPSCGLLSGSVVALSTNDIQVQ